MRNGNSPAPTLAKRCLRHLRMSLPFVPFSTGVTSDGAAASPQTRQSAKVEILRSEVA